MKKQYKFLIWFCYFIILGIAFELTNQFVKHNLLSNLHVWFIEFMFLGLGYIAAHLEFKLKNSKIRRKK